jgi:hypothetical protein
MTVKTFGYRALHLYHLPTVTPQSEVTKSFQLQLLLLLYATAFDIANIFLPVFVKHVLC